jgi:DNA-directed RNA polymerase specialized sigma24 family protein
MKQVPLENLTPSQREAYRLRFRRGRRLRRIAAQLGITVSSAGELVKRAWLAGEARMMLRNIFCASRCAMLRGSG